MLRNFVLTKTMRLILSLIYLQYEEATRFSFYPSLLNPTSAVKDLIY